VLTNELSKRGACKKYGLGWHTLTKILAHDEPPGYRKAEPRAKPKINEFLPVIRQILIDDRQAPKKQRHTAHRIWRVRSAELSITHKFSAEFNSQVNVGLACSPKVGPCDMRDPNARLGKETLDERQEAHARADHP
jgi:hypothetical protein